jgi:hypothetical protein
MKGEEGKGKEGLPNSSANHSNNSQNMKKEKEEDIAASYNATFNFIVRRALEPDNNPDTAKHLRQGEDLKEARQEWQEYCNRKMKEEDPIERYCYQIRGETPDYEMSFEQSEKLDQESMHARQETLKQERYMQQERRLTKPEGITKTKWIKDQRKKGRLHKEEQKQRKADRRLEWYGRPVNLFSDRIAKIGCECEAEQMRRGVFCDTCKLIVKVNEYMLELFKRTAQGR